MKQRIGLLLAALLLAGCGGGPAPQNVPADQVPVVSQGDDDTVVAEAVIEPDHWVEIRFGISGEVVEILVAPGDQVAAAAPLVRLDTVATKLSLQSAEQELRAQTAALERQKAELGEQIAQAEIDLTIQQLQLDKSRTEDPAADVDAARSRVEQLQLQLAQTRAEAPDAEVISARVEVTRTQLALDDAQTEYNKALDRPWEPQDVRDAYFRQLQQAELNYEAAQARLEQALDAQQAHAIGLGIPAAQLREAQQELARAIAAQQTYTITLDILTAEAKAAQLQLDGLRADQDFTEAEARLQQQELSVDQLELDLQKAELKAPFAGTVVEVRVEVGEQVNSGRVAVIVATLDQLQARTTDLTELDVARVTVGQAATVSIDALPGREFAGVVRRIALRAGEYRGDVIYDVFVDLTDPEPDVALRWGMTAVVRIETE